MVLAEGKVKSVDPRLKVRSGELLDGVALVWLMAHGVGIRKTALDGVILCSAENLNCGCLMPRRKPRSKQGIIRDSSVVYSASGRCEKRGRD